MTNDLPDLCSLESEAQRVARLRGLQAGAGVDVLATPAHMPEAQTGGCERGGTARRPNAAIVLTLPPAISANRYWAHRVVTPKGGRPMAMTYVTPEAKQYRETAAWFLKQAGVRAPLPGRVSLDIQMWPHRPLDWKKRVKADPVGWADTVQRIDADNCIKVVCDSLKDLAFGDDKNVWDVRCRVMEPDGRDACVVVTITPIAVAAPQGALELV